jgi:hypothetical protein
MLVHRVLKIADLTEQITKELRAMAIEMGWHPAEPAERSGSASPERPSLAARPPRFRSADVLVRLEDNGYIWEGKVLVPISRVLPRGEPVDSRFRAIIGRNPSRPTWELTGEVVRSLTSLSVRLRDEFGVAFPLTSFNASKYWRIEDEGPPERTIDDIARQIEV